MMQHRKTHQKEFIIANLTDLFNHSDIIAWQQIGDDRIVYKCKIKDLDKDSCIFSLQDIELSKLKIDFEKSIFLHAREKNMVFKVDKFEFKSNEIYFAIPDEILISERRVNPRLSFCLQDQKIVKITTPQNSTSSTSCLLVNLSTSGIMLRFSKEEARFIEGADQVIIHSIDGVNMNKAQTGTVCHTKAIFENGDEYHRLGLSFETQVDEKINDLIEDKKKMSLGIIQDQFCGLDYEDQLGKVAKIEKENRQLAINIRKNLDKLDRMRYLTGPMKLNLIDSVDLDLLACALRLSSKELIFVLLSEVTRNVQLEFVEKLAVQKPASAICKAQDSIIKILTQKESDGEYKMDPKTKTTYI